MKPRTAFFLLNLALAVHIAFGQQGNVCGFVRPQIAHPIPPVSQKSPMPQTAASRDPRETALTASAPIRRAGGRLTGQARVFVVDTAIVWSTVDTTRHVYGFNSTGNRTSDVTQLLKTGTWVDTTRQSDSLDARGNVLSETFENLSGGIRVTGWRHTSAYDNDGHTLLNLFEYWFSGQWIYGIRQTWTYDSHGRMLTGLSEQWRDDHWEVASREVHTYDIAGNMLSSLVQDWIFGIYGEWRNSSRSTWTYRGDNQKLSELYENWDGDHWSVLSRISWTYNSNGRKLSEEFGYDTSGVPVNSFRYLYAYGLTDHWQTELYQIWQGAWTNFWLDSTTYDGAGRPDLEIFKVWSSETWTTAWRYLHFYDEAGNEILAQLDKWNNGVWDNDWRNSHSYDELGRLIFEGYESISYPETSTRHFYSYDTNGNIVSLSYERWINASWSPDITGLSFLDSAGNLYSYEAYRVQAAYMLVGDYTRNRVPPGEYALSQNYPNPFNPGTVVSCQTPVVGDVKVVVYDILGRKVKVLFDGRLDAGVHPFTFDGTGFASGTYICRMTAGTYAASRKMLLLR
jgi:hypothetical protein